jgi:hypothetical protein
MHRQQSHPYLTAFAEIYVIVSLPKKKEAGNWTDCRYILCPPFHRLSIKYGINRLEVKGMTHPYGAWSWIELYKK